MIHTRASAVKNFYKALDKEFDEGWKEFVKERRQKANVSNKRMLRLVEQIKGAEYANQLGWYMLSLRAHFAQIRVARKPIGVCVPNPKWDLISSIWVHFGEDAIGKYAKVSVQVKPDRWLVFVVGIKNLNYKQPSLF